MDTLGIVNIVCVIILFAVTCGNIYLTLYTREIVINHASKLNDTDGYIRQINEDMSLLLSKIEDGVIYKLKEGSISILDLAEFKDLDPYLKDLYKKHIIQTLAPAIMAGIKKTMNDKKYYDYLKDHDKEITEMIYQIAKNIRYNGIDQAINK